MSNLNEKWESGELGRDEQFVQRSEDHTLESSIDEMLALQLISIRMPQNLLQDLKDIARLHGLGYQPLIKQILTRFVEGEKKMIANRSIQEQLKQLDLDENNDLSDSESMRKVA